MSILRYSAPGVELGQADGASGGAKWQRTSQRIGAASMIGGHDVLQFPEDALFALDRPFSEDRPTYDLVSNPSQSDLETFFGIPDEFQQDAGNAAWFSEQADEVRRAGYGRPNSDHPESSGDAICPSDGE